jgi:ABC-2 type transport system permease protein
MPLALRLILMVVKRRLAYRGDLILAGLDELMRGAVALAMLQVYATKTTHIGDWTPEQLLFVLGFSLVPISFFHAFCGNLYSLSSTYIIQGNLDRVLLRPYPTFLQICLDRVYVEDLSGAVLGISVMVIAALRIPGFDWGPVHLALLVLLLMSSFGVVIAVFMAFASTGFWFEDRVGMVPPVYNLMEFGRWPSSIYHWSIKLLITCVIPFSFVAFLPASLFVGSQHDWFPALATPGVAVLSLLVANALWGMGLRKYHSAGN